MKKSSISQTHPLLTAEAYKARINTPDKVFRYKSPTPSQLATIRLGSWLKVRNEVETFWVRVIEAPTSVNYSCKVQHPVEGEAPALATAQQGQLIEVAPTEVINLIK